MPGLYMEASIDKVLPHQTWGLGTYPGGKLHMSLTLSGEWAGKGHPGKPSAQRWQLGTIYQIITEDHIDKSGGRR